ncbi:hypothetical protein D6856_13970 [Butyrivibrio sp. XB500-5]|uniref:hypothetical protein n=1 Tax=Butyrivibrio sp. XB500-5 TaxID=2364880 RepID=UPI000EA89C66|nr:hypothetical protein [Butyrivibrio sp. XB500-5]RKM57758.1 hypothetical protein D6856_13970 [Butyrivibrio sp. XB500-5]
MGFNDGKFYDAKLSRDYYEGLRKSRRDFDDNADLVRIAHDAFDSNALYNGDTARAHKRFIKNGCGKMLNDDTKMMEEMTAHQEYMMNTFEGMVDADPNARIEINTLDTINRDFKAFHGRFKELTEHTHKVVTDLNNEFGAEVGGFPFPNGPAALEPLTLLCGGEDPGKGYLKDCQNMLISYDDTVHGYLKTKEIPYNTLDLNKRVKATKQIINAYAYADPDVDGVKIDQLEGPKAKAVKVVNKRMDDFCSEIEKYFDKKIDQSTVIGDGKNSDDGSFLCSFEMIEASKSPQAKAVLSSPYYTPAKKLVTENAKPYIADSNAYKITPRDTAIAFGVAGAAQSYVESGNISAIGDNAANFYEAFQQGGASYVIDSVAGTCSMPGAQNNIMNLLATNNGGQVYEMTYDDNNVLPDPTGVQGLINLNTTTAGINGQITNTWNNIGSTVGSQGQGNIGAALENLFQAFGYITVFGSSFFNSNAGSSAGSPFKGIDPKMLTTKMIKGASLNEEDEEEEDTTITTPPTNVTNVNNTTNTTRTTNAPNNTYTGGQTTITSLSKAQELLLIDPATGKYGFEELAERIRNGEQPTKEELDALAEIFESYFGRLEDGTARPIDYEVAGRLLKVLVDAQETPGSYQYIVNEELSKKILSRLDPNSLAALTINRLKFKGELGDEVANGKAHSMEMLSFSITKDRAGIALTMNVDSNNDGNADFTYHKGRIVSLESATTYIQKERAKDSKFGNGVPTEELARILTSVQTKNDMNFFECLINDGNYDDAFSLTDELTLTAQMGLADYHMYFYETDANGNLVENEKTKEFIKILNSALKGGESTDDVTARRMYTNYLYTAAELRAASYAYSFSCYGKDANLGLTDEQWNALNGQYIKELNLANLYGLFAEKTGNINGFAYYQVDGIKQISEPGGLAIDFKKYDATGFDPTANHPVLVFEPGKTETHVFYTFDGDLATGLQNQNMDLANRVDELLDEKAKNALKTLAKDAVNGVAAFFGPEALILAAVINLGISGFDATQKKISLNAAYTNAIKAASQNTECAAILSGLNTASNVGSAGINLLSDLIIWNQSVADSLARQSEESLEYRALWFGTGAYTYVGSNKIDIIYNPTIVSPRCVSHIADWNEKGFAGVMGWTNTDEIISYLKENHGSALGDDDIKEIEKILNGGDGFSVLELDDYSEFNGYMNHIQNAYNAINGDEKDINVMTEWSELCQQ